MRLITLALLALPLPFADADKVAGQKKTAQENWEALGAGPAAFAETPHLLVYAPKSYEKRLKDVGAALEKQYEQARKPLGYDKEEPWPGKIAVYLIPDRDAFTRFVRRVEKRRVEAEDAGSHGAEGDFPHAVGGPPRAKTDPSVEGQTAEQLAAALLVRKAGDKVPLPGWLVAGFGRATWLRTRPNDKAVQEERKVVRALVLRGRKANEIWGGTLEGDEAAVLQASLADFLAYGPGQAKFAALLGAFRPEENQDRKTTEQALQGAGLTTDVVNARWREWALNPR